MYIFGGLFFCNIEYVVHRYYTDEYAECVDNRKRNSVVLFKYFYRRLLIVGNVKRDVILVHQIRYFSFERREQELTNSYIIN